MYDLSIIIPYCMEVITNLHRFTKWDETPERNRWRESVQKKISFFSSTSALLWTTTSQK